MFLVSMVVNQYPLTVYGLAMVGHLKNVSPALALKPNRITNVEFTTVCPTIAKPMLCVRALNNVIKLV
jgi:hypothetical protein